jgi:hypothetical protein
VRSDWRLRHADLSDRGRIIAKKIAFPALVVSVQRYSAAGRYYP